LSATIAKGPRLSYLWLQQQWGLQMGMLRAARVVAGRIAIVAVIGLFAGGGTSAQTDSVSTPMVVPAADRDAAQRALEINAGRLRETNAAGMKSVAADPDFNKA
jgi:hypothetical protein